MMKRKVLIISAGIFPIPAYSGGAVEELIDIFAEKTVNNIEKLTITSCSYNGRKIKKKVGGVIYKYVSFPWHIKLFDKINYFYMEKIAHDWRSLFFQNKYRSQYYISEICRCIDFNHYDVIVVENNMSLLKKLYEVMGRDFSKKCCYHMHSNLIDNPKMIPYLAKCRKILAVSDYVKNLLYSTVPEFKDTTIEKITNGIQPVKLSEEQIRERRRIMRNKYNISEDETVYLFAGRVSAEKGVIELVQAYINSICMLKKSRLFIVGSAYSGSNKVNNYMRSLIDLASQHKDKIVLTGYIEHKKVFNYHLMADVQVVPSIMEDPAPLTVLEGMASGLFMILSNVGGIPEYSNEYSNRFMVERDENFMQNISDALVKYYERYAPRKYDKKPLIFNEKRYYEEFIKAIDFA